MVKVYEFSHFGGSQVLIADHPQIDAEVDAVIASVVALPMAARYSTREINRRFKQEFHARGYRELRDTYTIELPNYPVKVKGAFKQVDFVKDRVLVEVQLGKYFAMFYDMAKFQYFFNENKADVGVEIVPCVHLKRRMSSGVSYGEQLIFDIERLRRHFPAVPVKVILVGMDPTEEAIVEEIESPVES